MIVAATDLNQKNKMNTKATKKFTPYTRINARKKRLSSYDTECLKMSNICLAMANPTKMRIVQLLLKGEMYVWQIVDELKYSQSTISQHLAGMKDAGLICCRDYKTANVYYLNIFTLNDLREFLNKMI